MEKSEIRKIASALKKDISKARKIATQAKRLDIIRSKATKIKNMQNILILLERTNSKSKDLIIRDLEEHYYTIDWCLYQLKQGIYSIDGTDIIEKLDIATEKATRLRFILVNVFKERGYKYKSKES